MPPLPFRPSLPVVLLSVAFGLTGALTSCSKAASFGTPKTAADILEERPTAIEHETCDVTAASAKKIDANNDGRPDLVTVPGPGGADACRAVDLNFDGRIDRFTYFDAQGNVRRIESDYDRDGRIDEISHFRNGQIVRRDRELNLDGKIDTWVLFENGVLVRQERDADGDGKVDQWWSFPDPNKPECGVVAKDIDGDGRPEPSSQVDMCKAMEGDDLLKDKPSSSGSAAPSAPPPPGSAPPPPPPAAPAPSASSKP